MATKKFEMARDRDPTALGRNCATVAVNDAIPDDTKSVFFDADDTISAQGEDGSTITGFAVAAGQVLPWVPAKITAIAGSAVCYRTY